MTPAQEKALWDFVRVSAKCALHSGPGGYELLADEHRTAARTLLSVLAEEAPPAPTQREIQMRAGTMVSCKRCGHRNYYVDPERGVPCYCGAAPAPKQERGVEEILTRIYERLTERYLKMTSGDTEMACNDVRAALRLYGEERAASANQIKREMDRADGNYDAWVKEQKGNASLRERIARATAWRR